MEYLREIQAADDEPRRALRLLGGLLLGVGAIVLAYRRGSFEDPWGDFALFLVALLPALFLYAGGFLAALSSSVRQPWHGVFLIFGLIFAGFTLFQFIELVDGNPDASLNLVWIFAVLAALGAVAALLAGVRFGLLAAGIAFIVSWLALWDAILGDDFSTDAGTVRGFSLLAAAILIVAGLVLHRMRLGEQAAVPSERGLLSLPLELLTAGGIAFLIGTGALSATGAAIHGFYAALGPLAPADAGLGVLASAQPSLFWDAVLLVGSLALVGLGTRFGVRGPAYVGAVGLAIFSLLVGLDLDATAPEGSIVGWPLVLLLLAAAALAASVLMPARDRQAGSPPAPHSDPDPGPPPQPGP